MTDWQAVIDGSWPAERMVTEGPWTLRVTPGAGGRVNAISGDAPDAVEAGEAMAHAAGIRPSFVIWPEQAALDAALAARNYGIEDAVHIYVGDPATLAGDTLPHATAFTVWPPLRIMRDIWAEGGIGPARQAVMDRAGRATALLGRAKDRAAGVGFVSAHGDTAMIHALEVLPRFRRQGVGGTILRAAAHWAQSEGCRQLSLVVTRGNAGANALYASKGMDRVEGYHYRRHPDP
ncbi:MAG: GNAT family N-acetyltransferase [Pseudomonadota bacterium]